MGLHAELKRLEAAEKTAYERGFKEIKRDAMLEGARQAREKCAIKCETASDQDIGGDSFAKIIRDITEEELIVTNEETIRKVDS